MLKAKTRAQLSEEFDIDEFMNKLVRVAKDDTDWLPKRSSGLHRVVPLNFRVMPLRDFKGHSFAAAGHNTYHCVNCGLVAHESEKDYEFSAANSFASIEKKELQHLDENPSIPACKQRPRSA